MVIVMNKLTLEDIEWKEFKVKDIFNVRNSKAYHKKDLKISEKGIPYITRTSLNNGLEDIMRFEGQSKNDENSISLGAENADFFYQKFEYITGNKMYSLTNDKMNQYIGMFLVQSLRSSIKNCGFGYGKGLTGTRVVGRNILLPTDSNGNPNWEFMENYIKQEQNKQSEKIKKYYSEKMTKLSEENLTLEDVEWDSYTIEELFSLKQGKSKGLNHIEKGGSMPYLGATNRNNGVLEFVERNEEYISTGNCIAFIRNGEGSMGYAVYKYENFIATSDITLGYNKNLDRYIGTFVTTIADTVRGKYNFGYKRSLNRLKKETLILPVSKNGTPNWEYMRKYMKLQELKLIRRLLKNM